MDWFLYDNGLRHERVNHRSLQLASFAVNIYLFKAAIETVEKIVKYVQS